MRRIKKRVVLAVGCIICFLLGQKEIYAADVPASAYIIDGQDYTDVTDEGTTYWMKAGGSCTIKAPDNYTISTVKDGTYGAEIAVSEGSVPAEIYLKNGSGEVLTVTVADLFQFKWDSTQPAGTIKIDGTNREFSDFVTNPTEELFFKSQKTFTVTGIDTDSGVKSIEYLISDTPLDSAAASNHTGYVTCAEGKIECEMSGINYVYVRLTDQVGNQKVISTEGMVFYEDAQATTTELTYAKDSSQWVEVNVFPNDNTIKEIWIGDRSLSNGVDCDVTDDGMITFYPSAFSALDYGNYEVSIQYNPLGYSYIDAEGNEEPNDIIMILSVVDHKASWGTPVVNGGVTNYVAPDGTTSAEVTGTDVIWLKEEAAGTSAWYALDNSAGLFPSGSRFWVKWIHASDNRTEWDYYYGQLDDIHKNKIEDNKSWIFLVGVTMPDGTEYTELAGEVPLYIQLGDDWDKEDTKSCYISQNVDEAISVSSADREFPDGNDAFATLKLRHFSPYILFDITNDQGDSGASGQGEAGQTNSTPHHNIPLTADMANPVGWTWMLLLSLCGMMLVMLKKIK